MNLEIALKRFREQRAQARMRNLSFTLTFEEWCDIWIQSGKWAQRGIKRGQYVMSRVADKGGYDLGNVFIQEARLNVSEAQKGREKSISECVNISKGLFGHKHSEETKNKIRVKRTNQFKENKL